MPLLCFQSLTIDALGICPACVRIRLPRCGPGSRQNRHSDGSDPGHAHLCARRGGRHFTRAADSLALPKGTVTKQIQALEARLRVKLLNRTTRRVTVTPDGAAYYERASRLLNDWTTWKPA
jgi:hypothetical protein